MLTTLYKKLGEPEKAMDNTEQEFDLLAGTGMTEEEAAADAAATAREAQAAEDKRKEEAEMQASRRRAAAGAGGAGAGTSDGEEEGSDGAREDGSDEEDANVKASRVEDAGIKGFLCRKGQQAPRSNTEDTAAASTTSSGVED